jgi:hypothetical protein
MKIIGKKPRTSGQKKEARLIEFGDVAIWQFPGKYSSPADGKRIGIAPEIRKGMGIKPTDDEWDLIRAAWKICKSPLGYCNVQDLVDLTGMDNEVLHNILVWLVKHQSAFVNVDRWGNVVFFKFISM